VFARESINLTRIGSIPIELGSYAFFLDFVGSDKDDNVVKALKEVEAITTSFKMIGCYRERKV
jgi:prephenate dehydratase/chorismate mutase/prephenate dehydratase